MNLTIFTYASTQKFLTEHFGKTLTKFFGTEMAPHECKIIQQALPLHLRSMGLIRLPLRTHSEFMIWGTADELTKKLISGLELARLTDLEDQLNKDVKLAILGTRANTPEEEPLLLANHDQIGFLKEITTTQILRVSYKFKNAILAFDIAIESSIYKIPLTLRNTGFPELAKILIADDSKMIRTVLRNFLAAVGFLNIDEAADGEAAMAKIKQALHGYDLIIADWHMPKMNGIDILIEMRTNDRIKPNTPFILATSEQKKEEILLALKHKVSGYIIKPYNADKLFEIMRQVKKPN